MEPVVQAVMIADTLLAQCHAAARRIDAAGSEVRDDDAYDLAIGEVERTYVAVWEHLDRARALAGSGPGYDALRGEEGAVVRGILGVDLIEKVGVVASVAAGRPKKVIVRVAHPNHPGIARASAASAALKAACPQHDWASAVREAMKPAEHVGGGPRPRTLLYLGGAAALIVLGVAAMKLAPREGTHALATVTLTTARQVAGLQARLAAHPCEAATAETLTSVLRRMGLDAEADAFDVAYVRDCSPR